MYYCSICEKTHDDVTAASNCCMDKLNFTSTFVIKDTEQNAKLYGDLIVYVGKKIILNSDQINGLFDISLDGEDILLNKVN